MVTAHRRTITQPQILFCSVTEYDSNLRRAYDAQLTGYGARHLTKS
jgi:hypothetical protein